MIIKIYKIYCPECKNEIDIISAMAPLTSRSLKGRIWVCVNCSKSYSARIEKGQISLVPLEI